MLGENEWKHQKLLKRGGNTVLAGQSWLIRIQDKMSLGLGDHFASYCTTTLTDTTFKINKYH